MVVLLFVDTWRRLEGIEGASFSPLMDGEYGVVEVTADSFIQALSRKKKGKICVLLLWLREWCGRYFESFLLFAWTEGSSFFSSISCLYTTFYLHYIPSFFSQEKQKKEYEWMDNWTWYWVNFCISYAPATFSSMLTLSSTFLSELYIYLRSMIVASWCIC